MAGIDDQFISPIVILYLINSFFLIFGTSYLCRCLLSMLYTRNLQHIPALQKRLSLILKITIFFSVILLAIGEEYFCSSMKTMSFFPLFGSTFIKVNLLGVIIVLPSFIYLKNRGKNNLSENGLITFIAVYCAVVYLLYLIILMVTVTIRMNEFFYPFLNHNNSPLINLLLSYSYFMITLILALFLSTIKRGWQIAWFICYTLIMMFSNHR
jgi:hypothetical protein